MRKKFGYGSVSISNRKRLNGDQATKKLIGQKN
jgi:hypothetical protein